MELRYISKISGSQRPQASLNNHKLHRGGVPQAHRADLIHQAVDYGHGSTITWAGGSMAIRLHLSPINSATKDCIRNGEESPQ
jgi:hypothetical protein